MVGWFDPSRSTPVTRVTRERWRSLGRRGWLHPVDLDAALDRGSNAALLSCIVGRLDVSVQLSGGIRDDTTLEWALSTGCARVVLGPTALADRAWCARACAEHGDRIAVALDVRLAGAADGSPRYELAPRGGVAGGGDLWDAVAWLDRAGCARYVIADGLLHGPDTEPYRRVGAATAPPVVASGGVAAVGDLLTLSQVAATTSIEGAIVGTALAVGRFTLSEALDAVGGRRAAG